MLPLSIINTTNTTRTMDITNTSVSSPAAVSLPTQQPHGPSLPDRLPFPPLYKRHILNCALPSWYHIYRAHVPKTRILPLPPLFVEYLREDGIFLPRDPTASSAWSDEGDSSDGENGAQEYSEAEDADQQVAEAASVVNDPSLRFPDTHSLILNTISDLGGKVFPKLNWSAPKDAAWISPTNSLECRTPSDIYLLLKSSDFITHDLEHPFDDCADVDNEGQISPNNTQSPPHVILPEISALTLNSPPVATPPQSQLPPKKHETSYHLVLRKFFTINPSVEFRVFVKSRKIIALTQRDLNHYEFLQAMSDEIVHLIQEFYVRVMRDTFPDPDFTFDVYIPRIQSKVWLIDINPWARRTDPILFSWLELLKMDEKNVKTPELRLVKKNDPEAYSFNTPQYSAHKLPKEVVDAGMSGAQSIHEFAQRWRDIVNSMEDS